MNKEELRNRLGKEGISRSLYSLDGGFPNEKICLSYEGGYWIVYYSEKGLRTGLINFSTENEACKYIYDQIKVIAAENMK